MSDTVVDQEQQNQTQAGAGDGADAAKKQINKEILCKIYYIMNISQLFHIFLIYFRFF